MRSPWCARALLALALAGLGPVPARASGQGRPTWSLRESVELSLAASRALAGTRIRVEADSGVVTLSGDVRDEHQRERAVRIAAQTPGVGRVEQRLTVDGVGPLPESRSDGDVARDVARRLASQSAARAEAEPRWTSGWQVEGNEWSLAVDVDDGDVTLEGTVLLQQHLHEFVLAARGVPGVRSVRADVTLRPNPPPGDPYHPR